MRILKDIIKKEVVDSDAKVMGEVIDVEVDDESLEITDLVVKRTGITESFKVSTNGENLVPIEMIDVIGDKLLIEQNEEL